MLFNLLLTRITISLCFFFFFLVIFNNFFITPVVRENTRLKLALAISAGVPIMLEKEIKDIPPLVADKQLNICQYSQRQQYIYLIFYSLVLFL